MNRDFETKKSNPKFGDILRKFKHKNSLSMQRDFK